MNEERYSKIKIELQDMTDNDFFNMIKEAGGNIVEKVNDIPQLENGMVVRLRNDEIFLVLNNLIMDEEYYIPISSYKDSLLNVLTRKYDIVEIYKTIGYSFLNLLEDVNLTSIWKREEPKPKQEIKVGISKRRPNVVYAHLLEDGKCVKAQMAKCDTTDEFDFKVGAKIATDRLLK